jgi:hypothetical protein
VFHIGRNPSYFVLETNVSGTISANITGKPRSNEDFIAASDVIDWYDLMRDRSGCAVAYAFISGFIVNTAVLYGQNISLGAPN